MPRLRMRSRYALTFSREDLARVGLFAFLREVLDGLGRAVFACSALVRYVD